MPGLRGYSENSLKNMRKFYDAWLFLDASEQSTIAIVDSKKQEATITIVESFQESSVTTDETVDNKINIYHSIAIPNAIGFPIEDFFSTPFSHHICIFRNNKNSSKSASQVQIF